MTLGLVLRWFERCCRNEIGVAVETCLVAVIIIIFSGPPAPLYGQGGPASSSKYAHRTMGCVLDRPAALSRRRAVFNFVNPVIYQTLNYS